MSVRLSFSLLAAGLALALPSFTRADDELDRFVQQNRLLAQKTRTDANYAMMQARVVQKADPEQARGLLEKALKQVQNSTALAANEQAQLTSQLLGRLREVGELIRADKVAREQAPLRELPRRPRTDPRPTGSGAAGIAERYIQQGNAGVEANRNFQREQNQGFNSTFRSIAKSSITTGDDVTFPKDWAAKTKLRAKYSGPQLSAKEVALLRALNSVLSVNYDGLPFKQVIEDLQRRTGQAIILDPNALKDAESDYNDPINLKLNKVTFRTILRTILRQERLAYVIQEGTIQVTTEERARNLMVVRTYPVSDIVMPVGTALRFGPFIAQAQLNANIQSLVNLIQSSVDPSLWRENGGNGNITFNPATMSLIIRAPAEFHYQFAGGGLFGGR